MLSMPLARTGAEGVEHEFPEDRPPRKTGVRDGITRKIQSHAARISGVLALASALSLAPERSSAETPLPLTQSEAPFGDGYYSVRSNPDTEDIYDHGRKIYEEIANGPDAKKCMLTHDGFELGNFFAEKQKRKGKLSTNQYLSMLARDLSDPVLLHIYFRKFLRYRHDDQGQDFWQTPDQTVQRIYQESALGVMRGDCEDYAFLGQEIVRRQGKRPYVVSINMPSADAYGNHRHAVCVWLEERKRGGFDAYSIDTAGLMWNGAYYGEKTARAPDIGFARSFDAANAVLFGLFQGKNHPEYLHDEFSSLQTLYFTSTYEQGMASTPLSSFLPKKR